MKKLMTDRENRRGPYMYCCNETTPPINDNNIFKQRYFISGHFFSTILLLVSALFSNFAHSTDPRVCTPVNGVVPEMHLHFNMQAMPAGSASSNEYNYPTPVAVAGPIECATYSPTGYTIFTVDQFGTYNDLTRSHYLDLGQGFSMSMGIETVPGYMYDRSPKLYFTGGTPNIPQNYYASVAVYSGPKTVALHDINIQEQLIGYVVLAGSQNNSFDISDLSGLTAVYVSGYIYPS